MQTRQWLNRSQPQTLQTGVMLLYLNAVLTLVFGGFAVSGLFGVLSVAVLVAEIAGGYGIANERRWGYRVGVTAAGAILALYLLAAVVIGIGLGIVLDLVFAGALLGLLLHPMSRSYEKIWFH